MRCQVSGVRYQVETRACRQSILFFVILSLGRILFCIERSGDPSQAQDDKYKYAHQLDIYTSISAYTLHLTPYTSYLIPDLYLFSNALNLTSILSSISFCSAMI